MTTLETLFSPMQKEKLRQAALVRTSCRSFAGAPDTAAFAALSYVVGRCALPGAFALTISDRALLDGGIALCHAELALRGVHRWVYSAAHGGITAVAQGKFVP